MPETPTFVTPSEHQVWTRLRDSLPHNAVLIANQRLTDETKDYEADLIVMFPDVGIVVLEVKGSSVWHDQTGWWIKRDHDARIYPVDQAREAKHALRNYIESDPRWGSRGRVSWAHGVVTPFSSFPQDFSVPELPRWALHDKDDQEDLARRFHDNAWGLAHNRRPPSGEDVDLIVEILTGRSHTGFDVNAAAAERSARADRLTQEQDVLLKVTRLLHRVEIRGGAGSGKTVLALQQAKELTRGFQERKPQRVAVVCYSIGLATYLKRVVEGWPRQHRPRFVGTYEEFGKQWGAPEGDETDSAFWEEDLPRAMGELARALPAGKKYDAVIVDEAQDFADSWWAALLNSLANEETGGIYVYSDENQRIFARFGQPPVQLVPLVLDHNLRNTKQIHECFGPLAPSRMYSRGSDGPAVRFVGASPAEALNTADDEAVALLDEGWDPGNVALLTTGRRHPEQVSQTQKLGKVAYWRTFWEGEDVFYGHVLGCKGLERAAVVLCINDAGDRERAREKLYVGMSRATDLLVVVGDPDVVRRVGGEAVARRLGIG